MVAKSGFLGYVLIFVQTKMEHLCVFVTYRIMPRIHAFWSVLDSVVIKENFTQVFKASG